MILNAASILMLFMAGLGLALALLLAGATVLAARRLSACRDERQTSEAEASFQFVRLVALISLIIALLGWPLFYTMLGSFVPEVPGAMCLFGVTQVLPRLSLAIQTLLPVLVFVLGGWLVLETAWRRSGRPVRSAGGVFVLFAGAGLFAGTAGTQFYYILNMKSLNNVSCCSSYGESEDARLRAPSYYLPWAPSKASQRKLLSALFLGGLPLLALWLSRVGRAARSNSPTRFWKSALLLVITFALAAVAVLAFSNGLAARLMGLPFHNCIYCYISNGQVPESPLVLANLGTGLILSGWTALLGLASSFGWPDEATGMLRRRLAFWSATALAAAFLMILLRLSLR